MKMNIFALHLLFFFCMRKSYKFQILCLFVNTCALIPLAKNKGNENTAFGKKYGYFSHKTQIFFASPNAKLKKYTILLNRCFYC